MAWDLGDLIQFSVHCMVFSTPLSFPVPHFWICRTGVLYLPCRGVAEMSTLKSVMLLCYRTVKILKPILLLFPGFLFLTFCFAKQGKITKLSKIAAICCSCSVCLFQSLQSFIRIFAVTSYTLCWSLMTSGPIWTTAFIVVCWTSSHFTGWSQDCWELAKVFH